MRNSSQRHCINPSSSKTRHRIYPEQRGDMKPMQKPTQGPACVITKSFRPGEVWGKLWVNHARMSEIVLELGPRRNFPLGKDWQGREASFSSFSLVHGAWSQP